MAPPFGGRRHSLKSEYVICTHTHIYMKVLYGLPTNRIDVTTICLERLVIDNIMSIPSGDILRASYFTDPAVGYLKSVFIIDGQGNEYCFNDTYEVQVDMSNKNIAYNNVGVDTRIDIIHSKLQLLYGSFQEELPEQKMVVRYLTGKEKVLEIGGNIGRNSLIIAHMLENSKNLLTLECDVNIAKQLADNRDLNNFSFNIESSALSKRKLIQRGWDTIPSDVLLPDYVWVNTITLDELRAKYNIQFDTLVLDCEGAFYYILMDMPQILENINLIIMENDYHDITKKNYVDEILKQNNFRVDYVEAGGWGPCYNNFFEVWKR